MASSREHGLQLLDIREDAGFEVLDFCENDLRQIVGDLGVDGLLVAVQREIVVLAPDFLHGHEEVLGGALAWRGGIALFPLGDKIGKVVFIGLLDTLVVEGAAVGLHIVEPDMIGASALGENKDGGGDARVGLEDAGGKGNDGFQLMVVHEHLAHAHMGGAGAEEDSIGNDDGGLAALIEHSEDENEEEEFAFLGLHPAAKAGVHVIGIDRAFERGIRRDDGEAAAGKLGMPLGEAGVEGILVVDAGGLDAVEEKIHGRDAEHGLVEVEALEEPGLNVVAIGFQKVAGKVALHLTVVVASLFDERWSGKLLQEIFDDGDKEARSAGGRIAAAVGGLGIEDFDHGPDDVARGAELPSDACRAELGKEIFVEVALGVSLGQGKLLDSGDRADEEVAGGDEAVRILQKAAETGALGDFIPHEWEKLVTDDLEHFVAAEVSEAGPAEILPLGGECSCERAREFLSPAFVAGFRDIEQPGEHEVADLLDDGDRIGDAAGVELQPEGVDLGFEAVGNHEIVLSGLFVELAE